MHPQITIPFGYCACGCGEKTARSSRTRPERGYVAGQPLKFIKGHSSTVPAYIVDETTGCWIWQRKKVGNGYGEVWSDGKMRLAHRVFYERRFGPIPDGLEVDHVVCHNPSCVNADHLEPVTTAINNQRRRTTRITVDLAAEVRERAKSETQSSIARSLGVSPSLVSLIVSGKRWR